MKLRRPPPESPVMPYKFYALLLFFLCAFGLIAMGIYYLVEGKTDRRIPANQPPAIENEAPAEQ